MLVPVDIHVTYICVKVVDWWLVNRISGLDGREGWYMHGDGEEVNSVSESISFGYPVECWK